MKSPSLRSWGRAIFSNSGFSRRSLVGNRVYLMVCLFLISALGPTGYSKEDEDVASWSVENGGFFKNRKLKSQLDLIFNEEKESFDSSDIEDAALILISYMEGEGYLTAKAVGEITLLNGETTTVEWDGEFDVFLPRDTAAKQVRFKLLHGPRFYYENLSIEGNQVLTSEEVEAFFYNEPLLFQGDKSKLFSKSLLQSSKGNLKTHLNTLGFYGAQVKAELVEFDKESGGCSVHVVIDEGQKHLVGSVVLRSTDEGLLPELDLEKYVDQPYSRFITQDVSKELRNRYYEMGFPDATIKSSLEFEDGSEGTKKVTIRLEVTPGSQAFVSSISYSGSSKTKPSLIRSRLKLDAGDPLNPSLLERSRLNLSRLGIFDKVEYELVADGETERSVHFSLDERTTWSVDTIVGWGSYEQLRGGFLVEKINVFGVGHRARMKAIASLKSHLGEFRYLVPSVFDTPLTLSAKVFGLEREEIAFEREDFGLDVGLSRRFDKLGIDANTIYSIRTLDVLENELVDSLANQEGATVGSFELRLGKDRRDSAINPRSGYRATSHWEWASTAFGGEVDFQRAEFTLSHHAEMTRGLYWHGGITHGVIGSFSESQGQIPASMLFYPGGENSVRGYQRSEAAPKEGEKFQGAQAFILVNLELEQAFSRSLSLVLFLDAVGTASNIDEYPFDDTLSSSGLGLRYRTFMGPLRLEYGRNLNRRDFDPKGTLHFSLGYPF